MLEDLSRRPCEATDSPKDARALFRGLNERQHGLNAELARLTGIDFLIVCECGSTDCIEQIEIDARDYEAVRAHPRRYLVRREHVDRALERVVVERSGYVVVEVAG